MIGTLSLRLYKYTVTSVVCSTEHIVNVWVNRCSMLNVKKETKCIRIGNDCTGALWEKSSKNLCWQWCLWSALSPCHDFSAFPYLLSLVKHSHHTVSHVEVNLLLYIFIICTENTIKLSRETAPKWTSQQKWEGDWKVSSDSVIFH